MKPCLRSVLWPDPVKVPPDLAFFGHLSLSFLGLAGAPPCQAFLSRKVVDSVARRMIDTSVFTSGDLIDQPAWVRLLWIGLVTHADSGGYVRDNVRFFGGTLLASLAIRPYRIRSALDTLLQRKCFSREIVNGISYLKLTNWRKYQKLKSYQTTREDEEKMKRREDEDEDEAAAPQVQTIRKDRTSAVNQLNGPPWCFSGPKALDIVDRLGTTPEDLAAWLEWEKIHGTVAMMAKIQHYRRPADVPELVPSQDRSGQETSEQIVKRMRKELDQARKEKPHVDQF